jgi:hypothetical protein
MYKYILLIFTLSLPVVGRAGTLRHMWNSFCEKHLIADDPYQDLDGLQFTRNNYGERAYRDALLRQYQKLGRDIFFHLSKSPVRLRVMGWELRRNWPDDPEVLDMLEKYRQFESAGGDHGAGDRGN